jgi:hypothetical protein
VELLVKVEVDEAVDFGLHGEGIDARRQFLPLGALPGCGAGAEQHGGLYLKRFANHIVAAHVLASGNAHARAGTLCRRLRASMTMDSMPSR